MTYRFIAITNELSRLNTDIRNRLRGYDLNPTEFYALLVLLQQTEPVKIGEIAAAIGRPSTSFTPIVDGLEAAGYLTRSVHSSDRRAVVIEATQTAKVLKSRLFALAEEIEKNAQN